MQHQRSGRESLEPPKPLPDYLRPQLVEADDAPLTTSLSHLRFVASLDELVTVSGALTRLGLDDAQIMLTHREGSPWLEIAAVPVPRAAGDAWPSSWDAAPVRLAVWRYTHAVYRVEEPNIGDMIMQRVPCPACDGARCAQCELHGWVWVVPNEEETDGESQRADA